MILSVIVFYWAIIKRGFNNWVTRVAVTVFEVGLLVFMVIGMVLKVKKREGLGLEGYKSLQHGGIILIYVICLFNLVMMVSELIVMVKMLLK